MNYKDLKKKDLEDHFIAEEAKTSEEATCTR